MFSALGNRRHFSYTACVAFVALGFLTQLNLGVGQPDIVNANLSEVFVGTSECGCDLCVEKCDVGCCCDGDCLTTELVSFSCGTNQDDSSQLVCLTEDVFKSSLPSCSCPNPNLLCVQLQNNPSSVEYAQPVLVETEESFAEQLSLHFSRATPVLSSGLATPIFGEDYLTGDPVLVWHSSGSLGYLSLPSSLNGMLCHDSNPIAYLEDQSTVCGRALSSLPSVCSSYTPFNALSSYQNFTVFMSPFDLQGQVPSISNRTVPVMLRSLSCKDYHSGNVSSCDYLNPVSPTFNSTTSTCSNTLLEVAYTLVHNGSGKLVMVEVDLVVGDVSAEETFVLQRYSVSFQRVNSSSIILKRSGNPGYVTGFPILAGTLSGGEVTLALDSSQWMLARGSGVDCSQAAVESVLFGEDMRTACVLSVPLENLTRSCPDLRLRTEEVLGARPQDMVVGVYGNSDPQNSSQWLPVLTSDNTPSLNPAVGSVCVGVVTSLHVEVLFAHTGPLGASQAIVTGVRYSTSTEDIPAVCSGAQCRVPSPTVPLLLQTAVTFIETSQPPSLVLDSTSDVVRKLPSDFLYPFISGSSSAVVTETVARTLLITSVLCVLSFL